MIHIVGGILLCIAHPKGICAPVGNAVSLPKVKAISVPAGVLHVLATRLVDIVN